jgi:high-affinity iron transporter
VIVIGAGMIGAFYGLKKDTWSGNEDLWEGSFSLVASIIITLMGAALLRVSKLQDKWRVKLAKALEAKDNKHLKVGQRFKNFLEKYAMFFLPFITVLREGLEAVVFIGGVGVGSPASAFPIPVLAGLLAGSFIGYLIYKLVLPIDSDSFDWLTHSAYRGAGASKIQFFLILSTCFLYLVAAGLFSKAVWSFEMNKVCLDSGDYLACR